MRCACAGNQWGGLGTTRVCGRTPAVQVNIKSCEPAIHPPRLSGRDHACVLWGVCRASGAAHSLADHRALPPSALNPQPPCTPGCRDHVEPCCAPVLLVNAAGSRAVPPLTNPSAAARRAVGALFFPLISLSPGSHSRWPRAADSAVAVAVIVLQSDSDPPLPSVGLTAPEPLPCPSELRVTLSRLQDADCTHTNQRGVGAKPFLLFQPL